MGKQHMVAHPPVVCGVPVTGGMHPNVVPNLCSLIVSNITSTPIQHDNTQTVHLVGLCSPCYLTIVMLWHSKLRA